MRRSTSASRCWIPKSRPSSFCFHSNNQSSSSVSAAALSAPPTTYKSIFQISSGSVPLKLTRILSLLACQSNYFNNLRLVSTQASDEEHEVTDEIVNRLVSAVESDPLSSKEPCAAYIEKLCRSGSLLNVARLLHSLHDNHIFLDQKTYNIILSVAGERRDFKIVTQIFKDLLLFHNFLGPTSYSNLAKAFSNVKDSIPLLKFVGEVSQLIIPKRTNIINKIIFGFGESGQLDKALIIFDHMKTLKCKPDVVTYNTVLDILGRAGKVEEMLHEFALMKEAIITPDIISYNTLINSLRKRGRLDLCLVLLQEMSTNGIRPDLQTYTAMIDSFGRLGRVEDALGLFNEMKKKGILPSLYIYRALISNLKKVGKFDMAISLLEEMNSCVSSSNCPRDFQKENR